MPKDYKTRLEIEAKTKGFDKAQRDTAKFTKEAQKGLNAQNMSFAESKKHIASMEKNLQTLGKTQSKLTDHMLKMKDKGGSAYKLIEEQLKAVTKEAGMAQRTIGTLERAFSKQRESANKAEEDRKRAASSAARDQRRAQAQAETMRRREEAAQQRIAQQRKGAFVQGLAQGGLQMPAAFLQRGPGMGRQLAGMAVGKGISGAMGAGAAFTGVGGLAKTLSAIPGVGGILAGQLQATAGYAGQGISYKKTQLEAGRFVGGSYADPSAKKAARRARKMREAIAADEAQRSSEIDAAKYRVQKKARKTAAKKEEADAAKRFELAAKMGPEAIQAEVIQQAWSGMVKSVGDWISPDDDLSDWVPPAPIVEGGIPGPGMFPDAGGYMLPGTDEQVAGQDYEATNKTKAKLTKAQRKAAQKRRKGRNVGFGGMGALGLQLRGINKQQALQEAMQVMESGGGFIGEAKKSGIMPTAFAAKTMYGLGADVSGAFLRGGRTGGLVGGTRTREGGEIVGRSGDAMREAIVEGLEMGLTGSDLNTYMQQVAQGIQQFQQTGIPFNKESISSMGMELSKAGIMGPRAAGIAGGFQKYVQGIGAKGPQGGGDLLAMQMMGGFRGGGSAEYERALIQMEDMQGQLGSKGISGAASAGSKMGGMFKRIMSMTGSDKAGGRQLLRRFLSERGIQTGAREMAVLGKTLQGEALTAEEQKYQTMAAQQRATGSREARKGSSRERFLAEAGGMVSGRGGAAATQAGIENKQITLGVAMADTVQSLEKAALSTNNAFKNLSSEGLANLTKSIEGVAATAENFTERVASAGGILDFAVSMFSGGSPSNAIPGKGG